MTDKEFNDFWGEPISVYTDSDAIEDGVIVDVAVFGAKFNGRTINRATCGVSALLGLREKDGSVILSLLEHIAANSAKDRDGEDAWGIFEPDERLGNAKLWLVDNETGGYTILLPSEY